VSRKLRILYVGEFMTPQYDDAMADAFEALGHIVSRFKVYDKLDYSSYIGKLQNRFLLGPNYNYLWKLFFEVAVSFSPDVIYFRKPVEFPRRILEKVKKATGAYFVQYMNDDPFGPDSNKHWLKYFKENIDFFDIHFVFRLINVEEYYKHGAKLVKVLLPYYVPKFHFSPSLPNESTNQFQYDAIFSGHGEQDIRVDCFESILRSGLSLHLSGSGFDKFAKNRLHSSLLPVQYAKSEDYRNLVFYSNASLCFFSKRNRDKLTTRVFEIPAIGGVLVAERNDYVTRFLKEEEEAFFFSTENECVSILKMLKVNPNLRDDVAKKGQLRITKDRHDVFTRGSEVISSILSTAYEIID